LSWLLARRFSVARIRYAAPNKRVVDIESERIEEKVCVYSKALARMRGVTKKNYEKYPL